MDFSETLHISDEQQNRILNAVIGRAGMTRIHTSVLVSRAGTPPSQRDGRSLEDAGVAIVQWLIPHHIAVALYELMLEEKILLDHDARGGLILELVREDGKPEGKAQEIISEMVVSHIEQHFGEERAEILPITSTVFLELQSALDLAYQATGQVESLAPRARRDNDAEESQES